MSVTAFDTLKYANKLKTAGVPEQQAEAAVLAEALEVNLRELVTKRDLKEELGKLRTEFKEDIAELRTEFKDGQGELGSRLTRVEAELGMLKWMVALVLGGVLALILKTFLAS